MSTVLTFTEEISIPLPPEKVFKAFYLDFDTTFPKVVPQFLEDVQMVQGDGGPGSIKKLKLAGGTGIKYLKQRVDAVDKEKMIYNYTTIEGDPWMENLESVSCEVKLEANSEGGCKGTSVSKYYSKPGTQITEEIIMPGREKIKEMYRAAEAYVLANPNVCV